MFIGTYGNKANSGSQIIHFLTARQDSFVKTRGSTGLDIRLSCTTFSHTGGFELALQSVY